MKILRKLEEKKRLASKIKRAIKKRVAEKYLKNLVLQI